MICLFYFYNKQLTKQLNNKQNKQQIRKYTSFLKNLNESIYKQKISYIKKLQYLLY